MSGGHLVAVVILVAGVSGSVVVAGVAGGIGGHHVAAVVWSNAGGCQLVVTAVASGGMGRYLVAPNTTITTVFFLLLFVLFGCLVAKGTKNTNNNKQL